MSAIHLLRRMRAALIAGRAPLPSDAAAFVSAIDKARNDGLTLDVALGLPWDWRIAMGREDSDSALAALAPSTGSTNFQAKELQREIGRFAAAGAVRHRRAGTVPDGRLGELFALLKANRWRVPSVKTLTRHLKSLNNGWTTPSMALSNAYEVYCPTRDTKDLRCRKKSRCP